MLANVPKIQGTKYFHVHNFLLTHGITGHLPKLDLLQTDSEGHHAFMVIVAYGIQLLEREAHNAVDQYHLTDIVKYTVWSYSVWLYTVWSYIVSNYDPKRLTI